MASIRKIVSTPVKWVSKQLLHRTLLRFPDGADKDPVACTYCPEMCRFSCPTAVVSGNDAVTPRGKTSLLHQEKRWPGQVAKGGELWPLYDCTGCGRCTNYCKYEIPVADLLFESRKEFSWSHAREIASTLDDEADPFGDLAEELGDSKRAEERLIRRLQGLPPGSVIESEEPKIVFYLGTHGHSAALSWQGELLLEVDRGRAEWKLWRERLAGRRWLLAESPWFNRRLGRLDQLEVWLARAKAEGLEIVRPFATGEDCIESGGEGAYERLFPEQARQMALEFWARDSHRADAILAVSSRASRHFRSVLPATVSVLSFSDLFSGGLR